MLIELLMTCSTTSLFDVAVFRSMSTALRESGRSITREESQAFALRQSPARLTQKNPLAMPLWTVPRICTTSHPAVFLLRRLLSVKSPSNFHLSPFLT
nr:MAG TPA: hypothetical protein [Caudoviricetes sp.]